MLVALLLGETTINYIDRQVVSVLAPTLRAEFSLSNAQYAMILNAFLGTYAVAYAFAGWVLDRLGISRGLTLAVTWWSIAGALTALARGPFSLAFFRGLLAVGEAGAWPAFAKAAATWVPPAARTMVIGICNSGSSLGAMIAPPLVAFVTLHWGWRASFVVTGLLGFVWVALFQLFRSRHPEMDLLDRAGGESGAAQIRWKTLLRYRQTWAVFVCRFFADPLWYFFVFWIPEFLTRERGLNLAGIGLVAWIPFLVADVANFAGGYLVPAAVATRLDGQSRAQDDDGPCHVLLAAGHCRRLQQFAVLDDDDDLGGDLFLDPVVDHGPFAARGLLSAACGWLRLWHSPEPDQPSAR